MSELKKYKLGDVAQVIGGGTPSTTKEEYWNGEIGWLTPRDLTGYSYKYISKGERNITEEGLKNSSARLIPEGTVLMTSRAPIGYLAIAGKELCTNQGFKSFIVDEDKINNEYLYYLLKSNIDRIKSLGTGSTFAEVSASILKSFEIEIPDTTTQKEIASILTSLDDKIELNLQMNQTLEAMAQAIFKEWFVDFNFPGFDGELVDGLPKGWRMGVLSDVIEFTNGFAFKSTDLLDYPEDDCFHVFKMGNINKGGGFNYEGTKSYFKKADADKLGKYILRKGDLLMCMTDMKDNVALLGHTALMNQDDKFLVNQRVGLLRPNNKLSIDYPYLYILTNYPEFIKELRSRANRGVQVNLSTSEIKNTKIVIPEKNVNVQFDELAKPVFEKIFANIENIQELTQTRDTLLPKLISGQLAVV